MPDRNTTKIEAGDGAVQKRFLDNKDQSFSPVLEFYFSPIGAHNSGLTISSAQTLSVPSGATKIMMQCLTQNIRYTLDGNTVPTASVGFQLKAGELPVILPIGEATTIKVIQETATASLQFQFGN